MRNYLRRIAGIPFFLLFSLLVFGTRAAAHDPGLSSVKVERTAGAVQVSAAFSSQDAQWLGLRPGADALSAIPRIWILSSDEHPLQPTTAEVTAGENQDLVVHARYSLEDNGSLQFRATSFERLPRGHRQHASIIDQAGTVESSALLSAENCSISASATQTSAQPKSGAVAFFLLGLEHIFTGYDHLLFLLALLLVCPSFRSAALIISCFTLAHSLTLALAALDIVNLPSRLVEIVIAGSIVYVAVENLIRKRGNSYRWLLTIAFGLIHGLGFATVLQEAHLGTEGSLVTTLVAFNLGVEAGQLLIAALILPMLLLAQRRPAFQRRWFPVASGLISMAGAWWLVERAVS